MLVIPLFWRVDPQVLESPQGARFTNQTSILDFSSISQLFLPVCISLVNR